MLIFRETGKKFHLQGDLSKRKTNKNYDFDLVSLSGKKLMYDFAKEIYFDARAQCNKSTRDETLVKIPKSPGLMISASGN